MKTTHQEKLQRILDSCTNAEQRKVAQDFIDSFKEEKVYYDKLATAGHIAAIVTLFLLGVFALYLLTK
jgi:hypothetical protein